MGKASTRLIAGVAIIAVVAGGWWIGVRHEVDAASGPLTVGGGGVGFTPRAGPVSVGLQPCLSGGGTVDIDDVRVVVVAGDVEVVGVDTGPLSTDGPAVGAVDGFPPPGDGTWTPFAAPIAVDWACGAVEGRTQVVVGLLAPSGGVVRIEVDYTKGLVRYTARGSAPEVLLCGPAVESIEQYAGSCQA